MDPEPERVELIEGHASYKHMPISCLRCGMKLDVITNPTPGDDGMPRPGDWTMCFECACLMVIDEHLKVRFPTDEDVERMPPDVATAVMAIHQVVQKDIESRRKRKRRS